MYFVAFSDNWCSTVPENWLQKEENRMQWPPKTENATNACKKKMMPKSNWSYVKYTKLLGPYDTFEIARQVEMAAVNLSTSDEASFLSIPKQNDIRGKGTRKLPKRYQHSDKESFAEKEKAEFVTPNEGDKNQKLINRSKCEDAKKVDRSNDDNYDNMEINNNNDNNSNSDKNKKKGINSNSGPISNTSHTVVNKNAFISTQKTNGEKNNDKTNGIIIEEPACQNCCIACRSQRQQILRKLDSILMQLQSHNIVQNKSSIGTVSALPGFTIKTLIALQELNQKLVENEEARAQFTIFIQLRRVPDGKKHVRDVLSYKLYFRFRMY